jgi:hypothetical protein
VAEFIRSEEILPKIREIVGEARQKIGIATYSIRLDNDLLFSLEKADRRGVPITIIHGTKDFSLHWNRKRLSLLKHFSAYINIRLHLKCYFNENKIILTSMNLNAIQNRDSLETGVILRANLDREEYLKAVGYYNAIIPLSAKYTFRGFCIRCGHKIPFKIPMPFCSRCWNKSTAAAICHMCGKKCPIDDELHLCEKCLHGDYPEEG